MAKSKSPWPLWMGIRGFRFVWHGEWSDPEIVWHNYAMNINDIEMPMWDNFVEACQEEGIEENEDNFEIFCKENVHRMREYAQMTIDNGSAYRVKRVRFSNLFCSPNAAELITLPAK